NADRAGRAENRDALHPRSLRMTIAVAVGASVRARRDALLKTPERHQRKIVRIEVVAQIKMIRKSGTRELRLVPCARVVLPFEQPCDAASDIIADLGFAREESHDGPRR